MLGQKGIPATYGGVERHVEELSARLAASGHEVTAYCRGHYTKGVTQHRGVRLRILPSVRTKHLDAITHTGAAVADALRRGFDVIHFHSIGPASLSFAPRLVARGRLHLQREPAAVVATVHALDWRRRKWGPFAKWCLRRGEAAAVRFPHRTIVVSRQMAAHFHSRGYPVVHIPNGVEPAQPTPLHELRKLGLAEDGFILWMGRFVPEKRVEDLICAFRQLPGERRLLLAGEFEADNSYCRALRKAAGDDKRILFAGGLYGQAKAEALSHATLLALPSELEGFPIVLLEAMRYARPVLVSDLPENLEAVRPGVNGFTFRVGDVGSLRGKLAWLLAHPEEMKAAGRRAETDSERYDWRAIADRTADVYEEALDACRGGGRGQQRERSEEG